MNKIKKSEPNITITKRMEWGNNGIKDDLFPLFPHSNFRKH